MDIHPVTLVGSVVRLEPLALAHVPDLTGAVQRDPEVWRYMPYPPVRSQADMRAWVEDILARQARGADLPFAVVLVASGQAVGSTRFMDIQRRHRSLEIGGTWYAPEVRRTAVNTESKLLLFTHAFEVLGCVRVQVKTDLRNERSQRAIERLGMVREGVLRDHMLMPDGRVRSSVYYSLLAAEWPAVKANLLDKLGRGANAGG